MGFGLIKGTVVGLALGDEVGTTPDFAGQDKGLVVADLVGGRPFRLAIGK